MFVYVCYGVMGLLGGMSLVGVVSICKEIISTIIRHIGIIKIEGLSRGVLVYTLIKLIVILVGVAAIISYTMITYNIFKVMLQTIYLMGG